MSFSFGNPPKTATGFTLPTNTAATASVPLAGAAGGDNKSVTPNKPTTTLFGTPAGNSPAPVLFGAASSAPATGFSLGPSTAAAAPTLNFGVGSTTATVTASAPSFLGTSTTSAGALKFGLGTTTSTAAPTPAPSFAPILSSASTTAAAPLSFGLSTTATTTTASTSIPNLTLGAPATAITATSTAAPIATTTVGALTFGQLEDSINKWTIDLEEQGKFFINQAKQLNAWDTLLISNGEKILNLNGSIERVKQQQNQLDHELDFVLAQQRELEDLIVPLEKELVELPITDIDRNQMYQFSEMVDSQLKQMSEDLKEIIEHINEVQKDEESANPITQIGRILNAHMNSLQWIDRNTSQISAHLEQITKLHDTNRKNLPLNNSYNL